MPLVSVVIPTRDRASLLRRTLQATCAQVGVDLDIVVVDDGSTAPVREVVADGRDHRIRVLRNDVPAGVSAARNQGIAAARGEWIAFLDDDDLWAPEKLERQIRAAERAGTEWAYTGDVNVDDALRVLTGGPPLPPDAVLALLPRWNPLSSGGSNVIVRAWILNAVGGFDPSLRRTEDWDLWIRLARAGAPACVCEPLVAYRFHEGNVAHDVGDMVSEARELASRYNIPVDMAAMHRRAAWSAMRGGRRMLAVRHYARAIAAGDLRSLGRAGIAVFHPAVGSDRLFGLLDGDAEWMARARHWLARFAIDASGDERRPG